MLLLWYTPPSQGAWIANPYYNQYYESIIRYNQRYYEDEENLVLMWWMLQEWNGEREADG